MRGMTMRFATNPGLSLELRIAGYQLPDNHSAEYDSDWLIIEGWVNHPRGDWTFRDPCLLTYEAARLADWLESLATDSEVDKEIGFVEPNLSFKVGVAEVGRVLWVRFALESRPPWAADDEDVVLGFPVAELELTEVVGGWREQLQQFPRRAER